MFDFFMSVMQPTPGTRVLDLGVTPDRTLAESNYFEQAYPFKSSITAASIEDATFLETAYPGLKFVQIKGGDLPFPDDYFDVVYSSAVIEHVGDRRAQQHFVSEILRISKRFFITTPNRQYPLEFHTVLPLVHWFPQPVHQKILRALGKDFWSHTENLNLLTPGSLRALFQPCSSLDIYKYRLLGLPSNLVAYGEK